jgi:hypothetical protein
VRTLTLVIAALDCLAAIGVAAALFFSGSDPATKGLDVAAGWLITLLLLFTGVPALILALRKRAPRTALALSLCFPVGFIMFYIAAVIAFAV